ncbi:NIMA interactive protein [Blastomyces dermatitidis ATCC 18188]|uniref:NIMA interactive protein n=1 Tax=Ajellomyces dermatitidis (strain ATCC 18188 / CBS 674.68) TaxID=653446 RepID=F2THK0_AJEDA|nr:NIMA interactive protein [Blastomyces dermatitidis ATCC 18188]
MTRITRLWLAPRRIWASFALLGLTDNRSNVYALPDWEMCEQTTQWCRLDFNVLGPVLWFQAPKRSRKMETQNLSTASDYINNLLLARGLLRNGKPIDFARPENAPGGVDDTMSRVINLVHDLVLRRDREAEQRENLATNIRALRSTEAKQTLEIERLQAKTTDLSRLLALAEGQERAFKATIHSAEVTNRGLKEQIQRMKTSIQQIRSQCATDVRKRDVELQRLKSHLAERQRGKREGLGVTTITITPTPKVSMVRKALEGGEGLESVGYSLKQETTEFLTNLCQELSDENDAMIGIVKSTLETLRNLQGLSDLPEKDTQEQDILGSNAYESSRLETSASELTPQYEKLSAEMDSVLEQLRSLLTNPSFVPLEEVEVRDNEIYRLRDGWEKMEERWKEAVSMMDSWHKRMAQGGLSVNIDELTQGMGLGLGLEKPERARSVPKAGNFGPSIYDENDTGEGERDYYDAKENTNPPEIRITSPAKAVKQRVLGEGTGNAFRDVPSRRSRRSWKEDSEYSDDELALSAKPKTAQQPQKKTPRVAESKIPKHKIPTRSKLSTTEKLANVESEAKEAEGERKKNERRKRSNSSTRSNTKPRRRKSTLTPQELQDLLHAGT